MILFYAAAESALPQLAKEGAKNILITMANGLKKIPKVPDLYKGDYNLLTDSGAFTYQRKGGITVDKWIQDAKTIEKVSTELISLDVIGDPVKSYDNFIEIIKELPQVIPTLHFGEDVKWLKKYLEKTPRVCIGGMVPFKAKPMLFKRHLKEIFKMFSMNDMPRFHALGCFAPDILEEYPFYSCDASSWQNYARFGEFHRFKKTEYYRMKSANIGTINTKELDLEDLYCYSENTNEIKLNLTVKALADYEKYLNYLWNKRNLNFSSY